MRSAFTRRWRLLPACAASRARSPPSRHRSRSSSPSRSGRSRCPSNWILGQVAGIAVDRNDHIWIVHRPRDAARRRRRRAEKSARDNVLQGRAAGDEVRRRRQPAARTGAARAPATLDGKNEHGIHIDARRQRLGRRQRNDGDQILKFTPDGKFIQQIGKDGRHQGLELPTTRAWAAPRTWSTDDAANEIYVADGYGNRRVIVFDSKTGAYKRHWGAYGKPPTDRQAAGLQRRRPSRPSSSRQPGALRADLQRRAGLRLRPRQQPHPGVPQGRHLREGIRGSTTADACRTARCGIWCCRKTRSRDSSSWPTAPTARSSRIAARTAGSFGQWGRHGRQPGQFKWVHNIAIDSKGAFTAEVELRPPRRSSRRGRYSPLW